MSVSVRTAEEWRTDILEHLGKFPDAWFTSYDLGCKLASRERSQSSAHGRGSHKIRAILEELHAEGAVDRREHRGEGAPYAKNCTVYFRITEGACVPVGAPAAVT